MLVVSSSSLGNSSHTETSFVMEEACHSEQQMASVPYPGHSETREHRRPGALLLASSSLAALGNSLNSRWYEQELHPEVKSTPSLAWASDQLL